MTRIKRLEIENFKCFQQRTAFDFGKITLLTGANSSGKSSVMYSILGALQSGEFPFVFSTNGRFVDMGDFRDVVFRRELGRSFLTQVVMDTDGGEFTIGARWINGPKNNLPVIDELFFSRAGMFVAGRAIDSSFAQNEVESDQRSPQTLKLHSLNYSEQKSEIFFSFLRGDGSFQKLLAKATNNFLMSIKREVDENLLDIYDPIGLSSFVKMEVLKGQDDDEKLLGTLVIMGLVSKSTDPFVSFIGSSRLPPLRTYLEQNRSNIEISPLGEGYLEQIIQWELRDKAKYAQLVQTMKDLELLASIRTKRMEGGRYEMAVRVKEDGVETSLTDIGFGVSQFLPIVVADLQLPNGSTLFVSQPETHLHPSVQSSFGGYLVRQVNTLDKNYIIETHSEYLLNRIRLAIVKGEIKEEDVSVYYLEPHPDGNISHRVTFDRQGRILGAPEDFFKTYMMDVMEIAMQAE